MIDHIHALPEGYQLQEYTITETLGFGGFGITYAAQDNNLEMRVAIKEYLPSELAVRLEGSTVSAKSQQDRDSFDWGLERFIDEARAVARFNHPNIIRIHRFFEQNGTGYIVMELIDGGTLEELLAQAGTLDEDQIRKWLWPVMDGLKVVHAAGYIHRDIKPQNIMMSRDGAPILLDFGAARMAIGGRTRSMTSIMTPGYAPLEQYQTRGQGPWTDVYALGAVMYRCISGNKPQDALDRVTDDQLEEPANGSHEIYSPGLLKGISAALAVASGDRPQSIAEWLELLDGRSDDATRVMGGAPVTMPPSADGGGQQRFRSDRAAPREPEGGHSSSGIRKWVVTVALLSIVGAAGYWWLGDKDPASTGTTTQVVLKGPGTIDRRVDENLGSAAEPMGAPVTNPVAINQENSSQTTGQPTDQRSVDGEQGSESQSIRVVAEAASASVIHETRGSVDLAPLIEPGGVFQDCEICPVMVSMPAGRFMMSSPASEVGRASDEPTPHAVLIENSFAMGKLEITEAEFAAFATETGLGGAGNSTSSDPFRPVVGIDWNEAVSYTEWLSNRTGQVYRLPTEAEWEYSARAGTETAWWWGDEVGLNQAQCRGCGSHWDQQGPAPVGSFTANPFGLHDVHGNVSEWVEDCSNASSGSSGACTRRVFKGGSFVDQAASTRSAYRYVLNPRQSRDYLGFRVARDLPVATDAGRPR